MFLAWAGLLIRDAPLLYHYLSDMYPYLVTPIYFVNYVLKNLTTKHFISYQPLAQYAGRGPDELMCKPCLLLFSKGV
jgi:hypothetical protein